MPHPTIHRAQTLARLVTKAVPVFFGIDGPPQGIRDDVRMDIHCFQCSASALQWKNRRT